MNNIIPQRTFLLLGNPSKKFASRFYLNLLDYPVMRILLANTYIKKNEEKLMNYLKIIIFNLELKVLPSLLF